MECPFCSEAIKYEAIVCRHCSRDLRVVRPMLAEIGDIIADLDKLRSELDRVNTTLERYRNPVRYFLTFAVLYVLIPSLLLVIAHIVVTIVLNISPLALRLASFAIPILFGLLASALHKVSMKGALVLGLLIAAVSITAMLTVTGLHDHVPILPQVWIEWREVFEYSASIFLAFVSGNILGVLIFQVMPRLLTHGGKPNTLALKAARLLGQHVGDDQLRRRARLIQNLIHTAGPLVGVAATAIGSIYAGLKGILG
jgi:hypothetical protein